MNQSTDTNQHPISLMEQQIQEQGVVIIDGVRSLPLYNEPYITPHMVIGVNRQGWVRAEYDMHPVEFHPQEISVIYPNHIVMGRESSDDYVATLVVISEQFFEEHKIHTYYRGFLPYINIPAFRLNDEQYESINCLINLLRTACKQENQPRTRLIISLLEVLSMLLENFRQDIATPTHKRVSSEKLFSRFYDAIVAHCLESREVRYYANLLCLSPKYFGTIIKRETGISAGNWIASYIVIQAKSLLSSRQDLSVQQISQQLGFPDQATFSRYFKSNSGLSPKEYRDQKA